MIWDEIRQLKTEPRDLRKFGLLVGGVFLLLGAWCLWRSKPAYPYLFGAGSLLVLLGLLWPRSLKWIYIPWMSLGLMLGLVTSTVLLTLFFFLVVTPIGLLARAAGKDFLNRRLERDQASYWVLRKTPAKRTERYEQQF